MPKPVISVARLTPSKFRPCRPLAAIPSNYCNWPRALLATALRRQEEALQTCQGQPLAERVPQKVSSRLRTAARFQPTAPEPARTIIRLTGWNHQCDLGWNVSHHPE